MQGDMEVVTNLQWNLKDFCVSNKNTISSPLFTTQCLSASNNIKNVQWQLELRPYQEERGVSITLKNLTIIEVSAMYHIHLYEDGNSAIKTLTLEGKPGNEESWTVNFLVSIGGNHYRDRPIPVDVKIECSIRQVKLLSTGKVQCEDENELLRHYNMLLKTGKFSDVTFNIGEKKIQLHKAILTGESAVFRAMFDHEMKEQKDNVVDIVDVDFDVMKEMFRYMYIKRVKDISKIATQLFVVADRYSVENLKILCDNALVEQLNVDNALSNLELAVKYNMTNLKPKVLNFVARFLKDLTQTAEFKELSSDSKDELLSYISTKTITGL